MVPSFQDIHKDIIELSKARNSQAQFQLYQLYAKAMYNICYRMMNNREEAEDMLQEAFTEAFMKIDSFRFESSFGAWLKRITINKCINALKKRKADLVYTENIPEHASEEKDFDASGVSTEQVVKAMEELPEGYRLVFSLFLLEGYDHSEIGQILGISESTSKSQYSRARQKMQNILIQKGYGKQI
ncbi:MAG: sigma-70 family RNA polymerase sigma factor [Bacteroidales bacterium]|nr:sigma-70 family RNA polymerase sigma factor [Bacteroidales bacterium]MBN2764568.1 sigma-70 family RNA polymerase sigma factor [Bacteroidales bacterium]